MRISNGISEVAWVNFVRLLVILWLEKLISSSENHMDGSCVQKGGPRKAVIEGAGTSAVAGVAASMFQSSADF